MNISISDIIAQVPLLFTISFTLFMTLIDGKILNILTGTKSNQACPICGATPHDFVKVQQFKTAELFKAKPNTLQYGISPLHAWIRFFECIVHISYRYDLCKWQIRGTSKKKILLCRKKEIQQRFIKNLHLHVDKPKVGGFGSTNDCNSTRRAFKNVKKFSEITNMDEELIKKFKTIPKCISSQYHMNAFI